MQLSSTLQSYSAIVNQNGKLEIYKITINYLLWKCSVKARWVPEYERCTFLQSPHPTSAGARCVVRTVDPVVGDAIHARRCGWDEKTLAG